MDLRRIVCFSKWKRSSQLLAVTQAFYARLIFPAKNVNTSCRRFLRFSLAKEGHEVNCLPLRASPKKFYTVICRFDVIYIHHINLRCRSWWHFPSGFLNTLKGYYTEDIIVQILAPFPIRLYFKIFSAYVCLLIYAIVNWSFSYLPKPHL